MVCVCVFGRVQGRAVLPPLRPAKYCQVLAGSKGVFALWQGQMYLMCKASHPSRSLASGTHNLNAVPPPRRSASRIGESDGKVNRKRIKAIRVELQKKGWKSIGY